MGIALPAPLGGMLGPDGRNLALTTEEQVRPLYGTGHYGGDGTAHQNYRRGQVYGLSLYRGLMYLLKNNSRAQNAIQLLDEWEYALGLPHKPDSWTVEDRQNRISVRLSEPLGSDLANIEAALIALCQVGDVFTLSQPYGGNPVTYLVQVYNPLGPTSDVYGDMVAMLTRMTPAHVQCWIEFPDLSIAPYELGTVL